MSSDHPSVRGLFNPGVGTVVAAILLPLFGSAAGVLGAGAAIQQANGHWSLSPVVWALGAIYLFPIGIAGGVLGFVGGCLGMVGLLAAGLSRSTWLRAFVYSAVAATSVGVATGLGLLLAFLPQAAEDGPPLVSFAAGAASAALLTFVPTFLLGALLLRVRRAPPVALTV